MLDAFLHQMRKRRAELEESVFQNAPPDWEGFQHRFGQWKEANYLILELERAVKGLEDDLS